MRDFSNRYCEEIQTAKHRHWSDYLEEMDANDIWTANRYLRNPVGDGGSPRIPTLKTRNANGDTTETNDNQAKAALFADTFFPPHHPHPVSQLNMHTRLLCPPHVKLQETKLKDTSVDCRHTRLMAQTK